MRGCAFKVSKHTKSPGDGAHVQTMVMSFQAVFFVQSRCFRLCTASGCLENA